MKFYIIRIWNGTAIKKVTTSNVGKVRTYKRAFERVLDSQGLVPKLSTERGIWTGQGGPCLEVRVEWRDDS